MADPAVSTAGTARGRATRQRIVEATAHRILAAGIGGTSLDEVRAETLTSKSQLFHYFPGGKAELVRAVAQWEGEQLQAAQEPEIHDLSSWESWQRWREGLEAYYFGLGRWACPIGSLAMQAAMTDPELERLTTQGMAQWRELLAAGVRRMQDAGRVAASVDPTRQAAAILAALQGGLLLSQPERASWPLEAALDAAFSALRSSATEPGARARPAHDRVGPPVRPACPSVHSNRHGVGAAAPTPGATLGGVPEADLPATVAALRRAGVRFAFRHGSRVTGGARQDSDTDVAAWFGRPAPVSSDVDVPDGVDLTVLDTAPLELAGRIADTGVLLFSDDEPARVRWQAVTRKIWADERPRFDRAHREFLAAVARGR